LGIFRSTSPTLVTPQAVAVAVAAVGVIRASDVEAGAARQFGYVKVRFRGLMKTTVELTTLFAVSNLWMARKQLMGMSELRV
jgi:IS5 family transposase